MKNYIKYLLIFALCIIVLSSCADTPPTGELKEVLYISSTNLNLNVGDAQTLTAKSSLSANPEITWTSQNPNIATVDENGRVTAVALGTTTVIAQSAGGATKYCVVNVIPYEYTLEELVDLEICELPKTVRYYNKQTDELICEYTINSYSLRTYKNGSNFIVYVTLHGVKTYDKDGPNATNPVLVLTSLYRENGENCNVDSVCKNTSTKVGEEFSVTIRAFEVVVNFEKKRELDVKIDSVVKQ